MSTDNPAWAAARRRFDAGLAELITEVWRGRHLTEEKKDEEDLIECGTVVRRGESGLRSTAHLIDRSLI